MENLNKFHCDTCDCKYDSAVGLQMHNRNVHSKNKCGICDRKFKSATALLMHNRQPHSICTDPSEDANSSSQQIFKVPFPPSHKSKCLNCGKMYVDLSKHLKCSKTPINSSANTTTIPDYVHMEKKEQEFLCLVDTAELNYSSDSSNSSVDMTVHRHAIER